MPRPDASFFRVITPPAVEPVSEDDVKKHLRLEHDEESQILAIYMRAAREKLEHECRRSFVRQRIEALITGDAAAGCVELPRPTVDADGFELEFDDGTGVWTPHADYQLTTIREPATLRVLNAPAAAAWRAKYWSGYGPSASDVPDAIRNAILLLTAHFYETRQPINIGNIVTTIPMTVDYLVAPYRVPWRGSL